MKDEREKSWCIERFETNLYFFTNWVCSKIPVNYFLPELVIYSNSGSLKEKKKKKEVKDEPLFLALKVGSFPSRHTARLIFLHFLNYRRIN